MSFTEAMQAVWFKLHLEPYLQGTHYKCYDKSQCYLRHFNASYLQVYGHR